MEAELKRLGRSLVLTEDEDLGAVMPAGIWHSDPDQGGFHTVGRVISHKPYNVETLKIILQSSFNPAKGMEISFIENGRFLLKFFHTIDRDRVLASGPCAFEKNLVVLANILENENPAVVDLTWCNFHVRIHTLPIRKMAPEVSCFMGRKIGRIQDLELNMGPESCGSFMRLRVAIDVMKPLPRALKLRTLGDEQIVTFTYERLPNICYMCVVLNTSPPIPGPLSPPKQSLTPLILISPQPPLLPTGVTAHETPYSLPSSSTPQSYVATPSTLINQAQVLPSVTVDSPPHPSPVPPLTVPPPKCMYTKKSHPTAAPTPDPTSSLLSKRKLLDEDLLANSSAPKKASRTERVFADISNLIFEAALQPH
ncbi:UNVERIFIED_CONTAM: hypothetical protein Slati_0505600 [Sesamum latifolium]|uniref:DUF4283 domain-containing protein n=1 Tax=Sesamum latifolium TaxID=2727402 RepID=A0AAW2XXN9_9LAMI